MINMNRSRRNSLSDSLEIPDKVDYKLPLSGDEVRPHSSLSTYSTISRPKTTIRTHRSVNWDGYSEKIFATEGKTKWQLVREHTEAYFRATTLHGFAYMGEIERNWKEK